MTRALSMRPCASMTRRSHWNPKAFSRSLAERVLAPSTNIPKPSPIIRTALKLDPRNALALRERADLHVAQKDHDKAIADFSALIKLRSEDPDALRERAIAWFAKGDYRQAISDYTEAMRVDPSAAHTTSCPAD